MKSPLRIMQTILLMVTLLMLAMCNKKNEVETATTEPAKATPAETPAEDDRGTASAKLGDATISIDYGRPQLRGRDMLAEAYDGMVWRMGMNEATEIKTDADLKFGETIIPKGSYSLWMKNVGEGNWELLFNKQTGIWGTEHSAAEDFATVPMTTSTNPQSVEQFTIELAAVDKTAGELKAMWGTTIASAKFNVIPNEAM